MASLSHALGYVILLILLNSQRTFCSRLARSMTKVAQIGVDDYPSSGRNSPARDLGFPDFPSFQEAVAAPPPPLPDLTLLPPPPPLPDLPLLSPPAFSNLEKPEVTVPVWPSLPDFPPLPFVEQPPPSETFAPRFKESDTWMPSTPSNPGGFP